MGAFDPKDLRVGDVVTCDGSPIRHVFVSPVGVHEENTSLATREVTAVPGGMVCLDARATMGNHRVIPIDNLRNHITRVERGGGQIYPPPECPFKKGDRVRRVRNGSSPASTEVVASVGWVSYAGRPYWQITTETYVAAPADDFELVPEPPAFKKGDWVEHEELGIGHVIDAYYENEVLVDFLGLRKRFYGTRVSCDLKPYEPPVERVCDIIRESLFNATRASQRIHDRYILIQKDTP